MTVRLYLTPTHAYDRAAIMRSAWAQARLKVIHLAKAHGSYRRVTTARAEFAACLTSVWAYAKSERSLALWAAEQDASRAAEAARFASLTPHEREIEGAERALMLAEHSDTASSHRAIAEARGHLASLTRSNVVLRAGNSKAMKATGPRFAARSAAATADRH